MDKRTLAKIKAQNSGTNIFKLRHRKNKDGHTLFYEICRKNFPRKRGSLSLMISGTASEYQNDCKIIAHASRMITQLEAMYKHDLNLDFMTKNNVDEVQKESNFLSIFQKYYIDKYSKKTTQKNFDSTLYHLKKFNLNKPAILLSDLDKVFCYNFKNYLDRQKLMNSSKNSYLQKFKEFINYLLDSNLIKENPLPRRFSFKSNRPDREYLTEHDLVTLIKAPMPQYSYIVCKAFIFSCFTGLRWEDLKNLKFTDIKNKNLKIKQGKTDEYVEFVLPPQALDVVEEMKSINSEYIFDGIGSNYRGNKKIKEWSMNAELDKIVTWHIGRHTFACLLLLKGIDLYHVSKLLGHTEIKSTMKYLHVLKEHKTKATEALGDIKLD